MNLFFYFKVSFQENGPSGYHIPQHIARRSSFMPLSARCRANRPPIGIPAPIFLNDYENCRSNDKKDKNATLDDKTTNNANILNQNRSAITNSSLIDYAFPEYVRSEKERECWKLFKKMTLKGVSVTYDTILRGMLTPTEFRQLQKQRELEEAKAKETEDEQQEVSKAVTVERLAQVLLKK